MLAVTVVPANTVPLTGNNSFACGTNMILTDHAGASNYSNSANGYTVLEAGDGGIISITGTYGTEACCDLIRIYDGAGTGGTLLQTYAGTGNANFTGAAGQTLTVQFTSDFSGTGVGFEFAVNYSGACLIPCAGTPDPGNTTGPASFCSGQEFTLGLENATIGSVISYQWYVSTASATGPWTAVGPNAATFTTSQTQPSWYYCEVTCSTGPSTGASAVLAVCSHPPRSKPYSA